MDWNNTKDTLKVFGEDDYVLGNVFIALIEQYDNIEKKEDVRLYTLKMLHELFTEKCIDFYFVKNGNLTQVPYNSDVEIREILKKIDDNWSLINYSLPEPDELFWISLKDGYPTD